MNWDSEVILEDDCVLIRPLRASDWELLAVFSEREPEIWQFSPRGAAGVAALKTYVAQALQDRDHRTAYPFIVFDKRKQQYAGSTRFYNIRLEHRTLAIGFTWYGKEFQGTGLNKRCKFLLFQWAFDHLDVKRIEFRADATNLRSIAAIQSIGCTLEGILRSETLLPDGRRRDTAVLSLLKTEWTSGVREQLFEKIQRL